MRLITNRTEVLELLRSAGAANFPILCPNAETPDEMEGIMMAAQRFAEQTEAGECAVGIGFTATYPGHAQLGRLRLDGELGDCAGTWLGWLRVYADRKGLFERVSVVPFLDHGWAPHREDRDLMTERWFQEAVGILMFDGSALDFETNVRLTGEFVERSEGRVVVEGCPDKVYEQRELKTLGLGERDLLSDPDRVAEFVRRTGVDLIVPNLGTEHRTDSPEPLEYRRDLAREITRRVGPIQALHGTSSLHGRLGAVGRDGICKVNYYTGMARTAANAVRNEWTKIGTGELPLGLACGSFSHRTRREAVAADIQRLLEVLWEGTKTGNGSGR